ncbi:Aste57867_21224 [Aphanomyces stellatus]|uniref:Aste57867_21224 protein n=1 Tax=Aphanomyces stellatus TaxID=120398 RepID=A0A485LJ33_9STRA|nr:hypothetical protein As57867_021156 [Aphanomyces stellatus]VFT97896.1 Aste57867_21224 [Aphanomyces stellatus]
MMPSTLALMALAVAAATSKPSKPCPYTGLSGNITIALDAFCPNPGQICVVSSNCSVTNDLTSFNYVGDFTDLNKATTEMFLAPNNLISAIDATGVQTMTLSSGLRSLEISYLKLNKSLVSLNLGYTTISKWIMDQDTFDAINNLTPWGNYTNWTSETKGFYYSLGDRHGSATSVNTTKVDCDLTGGKLEELQPYRKPAIVNTNNVETKKPFTVCVTTRASNAGSSSTKNPSNVDPASTSAGASNSSIGTGAIVGIAAAAVVVLGGVVYCSMQSQKKRRLKTQGNTYTQSETARYYVGNETQLRIQDLEMVRLDGKNLTLSKVLGSGAFANVWHGTYDGESVAVKTLHHSKVTHHQVQSFIQEISLMGSFNSPYIVKLIGAVWTRPSDVQCVMEFMSGGDLRDHLEHHSVDTFSWDEKCTHIYSIAQGLVYLHSLNVIHRDLKSRNILLDVVKGTKLTDFGVSKEDVQETMTAGMGTFRWMAPEVIQDTEYDISADIYSFGCILAEFSTHTIPYSDLKNPVNGQAVADSAIMVRVTRGDLIPSFGNECPPWVHELALQCLAQQPADRPKASQVAFSIRKQLRQ